MFKLSPTQRANVFAHAKPDIQIETGVDWHIQVRTHIRMFVDESYKTFNQNLIKPYQTQPSY